MSGRYWIRSRSRNTPAHQVDTWDACTAQVVTVCGVTPDPGGVIVDRADLAALQTYLCAGCGRRRPW